jgi:hypothetical protein
MIWLVAVFCLGSECVVHEEKLLREVGYVQCVMGSQERLAQLSGQYIGYDIESWHCEDRRIKVASPTIP